MKSYSIINLIFYVKNGSALHQKSVKENVSGLAMHPFFW